MFTSNQTKEKFFESGAKSVIFFIDIDFFIIESL